jgi:ribosomal-protein-alanine N-acetyltransferase
MIKLPNWLDPPELRIRSATQDDSADLARIHAGSFGRDWSEAEFDALLRQNNIHAFLAFRRKTFRRPVPAGFVLVRMADGDSEILTIAVAQAWQGHGIGRRLMEEALRLVYREGVETLHLEVEAENRVAVGLYRSLDFETVGERKAYYTQGLSEGRTALVMRRQVR